MSEEVKIKISQPMFEVGELERFDNNIHNIVEEYSKLMFKEKDQILTQRIIMKQEEEIEILNNIINELEEDIVFCINGMKNEYACTDSRTNRELHTMVKILEESLDKIKRSDKE